MGWFTKRNPTAEWTPQAFPLRVDLNALTLNSIKCGDLADCLDFVGPGEHGTAKNEYVFPAKGLTLEIKSELLSAFHAHMQSEETGIIPYAGTVTHDGKLCSLGARVGVANLIEALGKPAFFEETDHSRILTYMSFQREWELILDREGRVSMISVYG